MASPLSLTLVFLVCFITITIAISINPETETNLHFYLHETAVGTNPTALLIAKAPTTDASPTKFGALVIIDNPLTVEVDPDSKLIGRAQGMYALASQTENALAMAMNFVFVDREFNGSMLTVLGRNTASLQVREMPVIGGSGLFRFARGYALVKTHWFDPVTANAIIEYDVHVLHQ